MSDSKRPAGEAASDIATPRTASSDSDDGTRVGPRRYCLECGATVLAEEAEGEGDDTRHCDKCGRLTVYLDYRRNPKISALPELPGPGFNWVQAFAAAVLVLTGFAVVNLLAGNATPAFLIAIGLLITSALLAGYMVDVSRRLSEYPDRLALQDHAIEQRTLELKHAVTRYIALRRDVDQVMHEALRFREDARLRFEASQDVIDKLGERYLRDVAKWASAKLTPNNFQSQKSQLEKVIRFCERHGYNVPASVETDLIKNLQADYELVLRRAHEREEQARIRAQIREEQRLERDAKRELARIDAEKQAIQRALDVALREAKDTHSLEIEQLRARLLDAEDRARRTISMAEQTKAGHVYVISNTGSFGDDVFKIGMTRRLEPVDRIRELGDASVPFPFDIHMMISCDNAPTLENALHHRLNSLRVNKVNFRKEFFRVDIETIRQAVEDEHGVVEYVADAEALEFNESRNISADEFAYLTRVADETHVSEEDDDDVDADEGEILP